MTLEPTTPQDKRARVMNALHRSRMRPYLDAAEQNEKYALALYLWHMDLTGAVAAVLGVTEVVLRNAMDRELQQWNDMQLGTSGSWLLSDPAAPLRSLTARKRAEANQRAQRETNDRAASHYRYGIAVTHDDVLAQVTFGMWKDLLPNHHPNAQMTRDNRNRDRLWTEALERAFPNEYDPDGAITYWRVMRIHQLRNRVSHMEPLLNIDVRAELNRAFDLLRSIDATTANWVSGTSRVSAVLRQRPI